MLEVQTPHAHTYVQVFTLYRLMSEAIQPYLQDPKEVLDVHDSQEDGLTTDQRRQRLETYGPNALDKTDAIPAWMKFLYQFKDLMILLLIVTALLSFRLQEERTAVILIIIVLANAII